MSKSIRKALRNPVSTVSAIGLNPADSENLSISLNELLSNYEVFYQNVRGFHWNIKGEKFFELHLKFEELYTDLHVKIDEIAERILTLGHTPMHTFTDYLKTTQVQPVKNCTVGRDAVAHCLEALRIILIRQRELLGLSAHTGDEGTNALMSDYITAQEKLVWMYSAYLG